MDVQNVGYAGIEPQVAAGTCIERADHSCTTPSNTAEKRCAELWALIEAGELKAKQSSADVELF